MLNFFYVINYIFNSLSIGPFSYNKPPVITQNEFNMDRQTPAAVPLVEASGSIQESPPVAPIDYQIATNDSHLEPQLPNDVDTPLESVNSMASTAVKNNTPPAAPLDCIGNYIFFISFCSSHISYHRFKYF
jgi:hypothetical protein